MTTGDPPHSSASESAGRAPSRAKKAVNPAATSLPEMTSRLRSPASNNRPRVPSRRSALIESAVAMKEAQAASRPTQLSAMKVEFAAAVTYLDVPKLLEAGAAAVFPTGTPLDVLVQEVRKLTSEKVD